MPADWGAHNPWRSCFQARTKMRHLVLNRHVIRWSPGAAGRARSTVAAAEAVAGAHFVGVDVVLPAGNVDRKKQATRHNRAETIARPARGTSAAEVGRAGLRLRRATATRRRGLAKASPRTRQACNCALVGLQARVRVQTIPGANANARSRGRANASFVCPRLIATVLVRLSARKGEAGVCSWVNVAVGELFAKAQTHSSSFSCLFWKE